MTCKADDTKTVFSINLSINQTKQPTPKTVFSINLSINQTTCTLITDKKVIENEMTRLKIRTDTVFPLDFLFR